MNLLKLLPFTSKVRFLKEQITEHEGNSSYMEVEHLPQTAMKTAKKTVAPLSKRWVTWKHRES